LVVALEGSVGRSIEQEEAIRVLLAPVLNAKGYSLVRVRIAAAGQASLQVMVERSGGGAMELEECADVSRAVSAALDAKDPIEGPYQLEISSPGIDRPLMNAEDFRQYMGYAATITLTAIMDGRKKIEGLIVGVADKAVEIRPEGSKKVVTVRFSDICDAKLVLTDSLLAAAGDMDR
tara:strand:- start:200 stop:730 length:531 start_codon:yes stop_codon:yes gene_type:complete